MRSSPPFGTISKLEGNLAPRHVPFFRLLGPCGEFVARGFIAIAYRLHFGDNSWQSDHPRWFRAVAIPRRREQMGKRFLLLLWVVAVVTMALTVGAEAAEKKASDLLGYVGSEACRKCHAAEFESWNETFHSKMVRKRDEGILKDVVEKWATDGENPGPTTANVTGRKNSILDVEYMIRSNWKQLFLVRDESTG